MFVPQRFLGLDSWSKKFISRRAIAKPESWAPVADQPPAAVETLVGPALRWEISFPDPRPTVGFGGKSSTQATLSYYLWLTPIMSSIMAHLGVRGNRSAMATTTATTAQPTKFRALSNGEGHCVKRRGRVFLACYNQK